MPRLIESLSGERVVSIACGSAHSACVTARGHLYTWGLGEYGRLGHGDDMTQLLPKMVDFFLQSLNLILYNSYARLFFYNFLYEVLCAFNICIFFLYLLSHQSVLI